MIKTNNRHFAPFESPTWSLLVKPESKINHETRQFFIDTVDTSRLLKRKSPKADLKLQHKKVFEFSLAFTLVLVITMFQLARQYSLAPASISTTDVIIEVADIPVTEQILRPLSPARPSIPIPTEEESIPEDETIAFAGFDLRDIPPPPPPQDENDEPALFVAYDEPPKIIGGFAEVSKNLKYPQVAVNAAVEGVVVVKVLVGVDGQLEKLEVIRAKPSNIGFEESALEALKKVKWEPARLRDRKVRVWVSIPVRFNLAS